MQCVKLIQLLCIYFNVMVVMYIYIFRLQVKLYLLWYFPTTFEMIISRELRQLRPCLENMLLLDGQKKIWYT